MENAYEASTVEMTKSGYNDLQNQLLNNKTDKTAKVEVPEVKEKKEELKVRI